MSTTRLWVVGSLVSSLGLASAGCAVFAEKGGAQSPAPVSLRSQRRLAYKLAGPVAIAERPNLGIAFDLEHSLRSWVRRDMRDLGLEVDGDPALGIDLVVHLTASVQGVGRLARARAALWVMAQGQLLEQIDSIEVIEAPDRLAGALARDLVERLGRSPHPAEYADSLYGRRLRPLRDTVGGHAAGREEVGSPPLEALNEAANPRRGYNRTLRGRAELPAPPASAEPARVAAQAEQRRGRALLDAGHPREAYTAFEQAYLLDTDAEPLFGMAESLLRVDAKQPALVFYRAYLRHAQPGSASAARAATEVAALQAAPPSGPPPARN